MKPIRYIALLAVVALCNLVNISAQNRPQRPNFNPEQMRERMLTRVREEMDVKDDADWKPIADRVTKVMEARREVGGNGMGMMFRRRGGDNQDGGPGGGGPGGGGGRFGQPSAEAEALQKALESKLSNDEVKSRLAKYRDAQKAKRDALTKAQEDLRKVLTMRQEAAAVMLGLLD